MAGPRLGVEGTVAWPATGHSNVFSKRVGWVTGWDPLSGKQDSDSHGPTGGSGAWPAACVEHDLRVLQQPWRPAEVSRHLAVQRPQCQDSSVAGSPPLQFRESCSVLRDCPGWNRSAHGDLGLSWKPWNFKIVQVARELPLYLTMELQVGRDP